MPMHDWTRVSAGTYHDFHNSWITHLKEALNEGLLPDPYYAMGEQLATETWPDVLALKEANGDDHDVDSNRNGAGMVAVAEAPPKVQMSQEARLEAVAYLAKRRTLVIRQASGDRIVALVEIISPANKYNRRAVEKLVDKVMSALKEGIHVMVIDPFPPSRHDPEGIHGLVWQELGEPSFELPSDRPLTLVSYCAKTPMTAYIEPTRVGMPLTEMPLFLTKTHYIRTPLEETYLQASHPAPPFTLAPWPRGGRFVGLYAPGS